MHPPVFKRVHKLLLNYLCELYVLSDSEQSVFHSSLLTVHSLSFNSFVFYNDKEIGKRSPQIYRLCISVCEASVLFRGNSINNY